MALISGPKSISTQALEALSGSADVALGSRVWDELGNEYVYLLGVASTVAGSWVTFDADYATALLTANAVGPVAIAMAANVADSYGWYQVRGINTIASTDTVAADAQLFIDGTNGRADDADAAGDAIVGALSLTADTSNVATVWINNPYVMNQAID